MCNMSLQLRKNNRDFSFLWVHNSFQIFLCVFLCEFFFFWGGGQGGTGFSVPTLTSGNEIGNRRICKTMWSNNS